MKIKPKNRLDFGDFVDRSFWVLLLSASGYIATQARAISNNIQELNEKMANMIAKVGDQSGRLDTYEMRIQALENRRFLNGYHSNNN